MQTLYFILHSFLLGYGISVLIAVPIYFITNGKIKAELASFIEESVWLTKWIGIVYIGCVLIGAANSVMSGNHSMNTDNLLESIIFSLAIPVFTQLLWLKCVRRYRVLLFIFAIPLLWFSALFLGELLAMLSIFHFDYMDDSNRMIGLLALNYLIKTGGFVTIVLLATLAKKRIIKA